MLFARNALLGFNYSKMRLGKLRKPSGVWWDVSDHTAVCLIVVVWQSDFTLGCTVSEFTNEVSD